MGPVRTTPTALNATIWHHYICIISISQVLVLLGQNRFFLYCLNFQAMEATTLLDTIVSIFSDTLSSLSSSLLASRLRLYHFPGLTLFSAANRRCHSLQYCCWYCFHHFLHRCIFNQRINHFLLSIWFFCFFVGFVVHFL